MLKVEHIKKQYDGKEVLKDISFSANKGEIIALLGPSGCGKTTLLNVLLGLVQHDQGSISYDGKEISSLNMRERGFNIVFQDYALFPHLSAYDNITYGLKNQKVSISKQLIEEYIDMLDLHPHIHKKISALSGGQKQRVAIARTLVMQPKILMLDEPLSALDGVMKETIKYHIRKIAKQYELTTILVTHDPEEALTLSDRVLIINNGIVEQFGAPRDILHIPNNPFIEKFISQQLKLKYNNIHQLFGEAHA